MAPRGGRESLWSRSCFVRIWRDEKIYCPGLALCEPHRDHLSPAGGKVVCLAAIGFFFLGIYGVKGEIFRLSKWSKFKCHKSRKMSVWSFTQ